MTGPSSVAQPPPQGTPQMPTSEGFAFSLPLQAQLPRAGSSTLTTQVHVPTATAMPAGSEAPGVGQFRNPMLEYLSSSQVPLSQVSAHAPPISPSIVETQLPVVCACLDNGDDI